LVMSGLSLQPLEGMLQAACPIAGEFQRRANH
jgi:hypothetical protein